MKRKYDKSEKKNKILVLVIVVSEILFVISAIALLKYYLAYRAEKKLNYTLAEIRAESQKEKPSDAEKGGTANGMQGDESDLIDRSRLLAMNEDYLFWLSIPDTALNYPVVQKDNDYYLHHNFIGEKSSHGTVFLDENCRIYDDMLLIHGHHMKDGTMFGGLKAYRKSDFAKEHTKLYMDFGLGDESYRIFAAALIDLTSDSHFHFYEMPEDDEGRKDYMNNLRKTAFWYEDEVNQGEYTENQIIILSTCEYGTKEQRMIVAAVRTEP